jgi:hypothetical protein
MFARLPSFRTTTKTVSDNTNTHASPSLKTFNDATVLESEPQNSELARLHKKLLCSNNKDNDGLSSLAELSMAVLSPPLQSHGTPRDSSGAFFSAQFIIDIMSTPIVFDTLSIKLFRITTTQKPTSHAQCKDCQVHKTELQTWKLSESANTLSVGKHGFPFTYVFPGDFPASTCSRYAMIDYQFVATAKTQAGKSIVHKQLVKLDRVLSEECDEAFIQKTVVFPSIDIGATAQYSPVSNIGNGIPIDLQLTGLPTLDTDLSQWRLKKVLWQVEEHQRITTVKCKSHHTKVNPKQRHVRIINAGQRSYHKNESKIITPKKPVEASFNIQISPEANCISDVESSEAQLRVWHYVIVDLLIADETRLDSRKTHLLRVEFPISLSTSGRAGVAWDKETPPFYQDVPVAPPAYLEDSSCYDQSPPEYCQQLITVC